MKAAAIDNADARRYAAKRLRRARPKDLKASPFSPKGRSDCDYGASPCDPTRITLGPGKPAGSTEYALRSPSFWASPLATSIDVREDVEITTCYTGTNACPYSWQWGGSLGSTSTTINTRMVISQMSGADVCRVTNFPSSGYETTTVTDYMHHYKITHTLNDIPVSSSCDRRFLIKLYVGQVSGQPIQIEPNSYSVGIAFSDQ